MLRLFGLGIFAVLVAPELALAQSEKPFFDPVDFVEYWSAARVHLKGGNPYDGEQILPAQQECATEEKLYPTMLWTPPHTLPLYWPAGMLPPRWAHLTWTVIQILSVLVSGGLVWRSYGGPIHRYWMLAPVCFVAFSTPLVWVWFYGQNTGLLLLGLAGFAYCKHRGWHGWAGVFAALTSIKPHFLALFGWALLLDAYTATGRRSLWAGLGTVVALSLLAMVPNPLVFQQFYTAITSPSAGKVVAVSDWKLPLPSYGLRLVIDPENGKAMWAAFLLLALGVLALTVYWWRIRTNWNWLTVLPGLVLGSALLAPYGGWLFDLVVLLFPLTRCFVWVRHSLISAVGFGFLCGPVLLLVANKTMSGLEHGWWITPTVLLVFVAFTFLKKPEPPVEAGQG